MRPRTFAVPAAALTALFFTSVIAPAQDTDTELLRAILCELKELRSAVHQGQVVGPLVEANTRERVQLQARISKLEKQQSGSDQLIQESIARQAKIREILRNLSRSGRSELGEEVVGQRKRDLGSELETITRQLRNLQSEQGRVSTEISRDAGRLAQLEGEFDQMQRQMRNLAAASGSLCESAVQTP